MQRLLLLLLQLPPRKLAGTLLDDARDKFPAIVRREREAVPEGRSAPPNLATTAVTMVFVERGKPCEQDVAVLYGVEWRVGKEATVCEENLNAEFVVCEGRVLYEKYRGKSARGEMNFD